MSRSYERFKKDLLIRVKQLSSSDSKEKMFLTRKFKYFDRMDNSLCSYPNFSNVTNRLGVIFTSKNEEFEIFNSILDKQKTDGVVSENSKQMNYVVFIDDILEITRSSKSRSNLRFGESSNRNNKTSEMFSVTGSKGLPGNVTTNEFEKAVIVVSEGMCEINLLYVLQHLNKEIKNGMGDRQVDYKGLLKCFMKIGLGFKYEVRQLYYSL